MSPVVGEGAADPGDWTAWSDGRLVRADRLAVDARDRGVLYGELVFETVARVAGRPRFLVDHLARFERGVTDLLGHGFAERVWRDALDELAPRLPEQDVALRLVETAGVDGVPARWIQARPLRRAPREGVDVVLAPPFAARSAGTPLARAKHGARFELGLARRAALEEGAFDALLPGPDGSLACGTLANLFVSRGERIVTPPLASGALPGVARAALLAAGSVSTPEGTVATLEEATVRPEDLPGAEEAWLVGSVLGVARIRGVRSRAGAPFVPLEADGVPSARSRALESLFHSLEDRS